MTEYNIPNKLNHTILAGVGIWIAKKTNDIAGDYLPVGNVAEAPSLAFELERWTHKTNQYGSMTTDRYAVIGKSMNFKLVIDELVRENLIYALGSSVRTASQTIYPRQYEKITLVAGAAQVNSGAAIYDVLKVLPNSGEASYTEGATADYTVNLSNGTITRVVGGQIGATDTLIVHYKVTKTNAVVYPIMDSPNISAALQLVSRKSNAENLGYDYVLDIPSVDISLDGEIVFSFGPDAVKATLACQALADPLNPTGSLGNLYTYSS